MHGLHGKLTYKQIEGLLTYNLNKLLLGNVEGKLAAFLAKLKNYTGIELNITPHQWMEVYIWLKDEELLWVKRQISREMVKNKQGSYTPTDKDIIPFDPVLEPVIGRKYHLAWAYKGAKFILRSIEGERGTVWSGITNRKLLNIKLKDLRHLR